MQVQPINTDEVAGQRDPFLAFVSDERTEAVVREIAEALLLPDDLVRHGSVSEARAYLEQVRSPRLLIVDIDGVGDPLEEVIRLADVCELGTRLIALGSDNDVTLFRDLLSMGAADYLVKPIERDALLRSISSLEDPSAGLSTLGRQGKVISFIGARGGAGVSTLVGNCGWAISRGSKRRVVMVDLDLHFGNLALLMGAEPREGLGDALQQPDRIDSLFLERVMSSCGDRLFVIGGEENLSQGSHAADRFAVDALIAELKSNFHFALLDLPRSASDLVYRALQLSHTTVVVSDLSLAGMRDTVRLLKFVKECNPGGHVILVVNRGGENAKAEIPLAEFEKGVGRKVDVRIGFEANAVLQAANLGQPLIETRCATSRAIEQLGERIAGPGAKPPSAARRKSLLSLLKR
jgi:pilus assembly protein CpaE